MFLVKEGIQDTNLREGFGFKVKSDETQQKTELVVTPEEVLYLESVKKVRLDTSEIPRMSYAFYLHLRNMAMPFSIRDLRFADPCFQIFHIFN